jgi:hypothetical protein
VAKQGESANLGQTVKDVARGVVEPAIREGRVSKVLGPSSLEVAVRSLMGDTKTVRARGHASRVVDTGPGIEVHEPQRNDRVWIATDEGGQIVTVAWERADG